MKILLLGISPHSKNMGVGALGAGLTSAAHSGISNCMVKFLDYGKSDSKLVYRVNGNDIQVPFISLRFSKKIYLRNNIAFLIAMVIVLKIIPKKVRDSVFKTNYYYNAICESDIIGAISGGDSFSDIYGIRRFIYVVLPQILVILLGKRLVLLPQTIGPFDSRFARVLARYIIKRAAMVYSRDMDGLKEVNVLIGKNSCRFCYDVGFLVEPITPAKMDIDGLEKKERKEPLVGFNISGLLNMGGYNMNNMFNLKVDYKILLDEIITFIIEQKNASILLVPHVFGSNPKSEADSVVCEKIYADLKSKYKDRIYLVRGEYNQNEIKSIIGMCDFFIGSRMHACIGAVSQNIATVSISYSRKFKGVMETVGMQDYIADPKVITKEEIIDLINIAYDERGLIKAKLEKKIPEVKARVSNLFREINEEPASKSSV